MKAQMTRLPSGRRLRLNYCPAEFTRSGKVRASYTPNGREREEFAKREAALLKAKPHLAEHKHCGICLDEEQLTKRIVMPNGIVLHSAWYERSDRTPSGKLRSEAAFERHKRQALAEARWMSSPEGLDYYRPMFA